MQTLIDSLRHFLDVTMFYLLCGGITLALIFGAINQAQARRNTDNPITVAGYPARGIRVSSAKTTAMTILSLLFLALIGVTLYLFWKYT
jgi:hypothetical protein